ncbi:MAG: carboxylating nicotinate-nucleotide diphosphorylase [Chitinispirillales bacterium]|jgi:nicotinate-nucleotide pyrophosphorylase (carboxylating)|nr:carboxylating nicotinate-nucleotide diphosphorylase [Chitinispirillales bacterium]
MFEFVTNLLTSAIAEDLGEDGDITTSAIFNADDTGEALIRCKQSGVLSGITLAAPLFGFVDKYLASHISSVSDAAPATAVETYCGDGDTVEPGKAVCRVRGAVRSILAGERTILNLIQRLSGIATFTAAMVRELSNSGAKTRLLDTRKTTPGMRTLEKAAVRHGGGVNHRCGLYDMMLIKDTHVRRAGGVTAALTKALAWRGDSAVPRIEIEVQSIEEFVQALRLKPDRIMLDNMSPKEIDICVDERDASGLKIELEASGNITLGILSAIAATNVDYISCGAITHSAPALDFHLVMLS